MIPGWLSTIPFSCPVAYILSQLLKSWGHFLFYQIWILEIFPFWWNEQFAGVYEPCAANVLNLSLIRYWGSWRCPISLSGAFFSLQYMVASWHIRLSVYKYTIENHCLFHALVRRHIFNHQEITNCIDLCILLIGDHYFIKKKRKCIIVKWFTMLQKEIMDNHIR